MSSIKFKPEVSGEDIRNLTMQWHCGTAVPGTQSSKRHVRRERGPFEIPAFIDSGMHAFCMLAGGATTIALVIAIQSGWIPTEKLVALLF